MTDPALAAHIADLMRGQEVHQAVHSARTACEELRWHPGLRRRSQEAAAESRVRGATASAQLEGAEVAGTVLSLTTVRDVMRGATHLPVAPDPLWRTTKAAIQVTAATEEMSQAALRAPLQVLARLHTAAAAPLVEPSLLGRPRESGQECAEWVELGPPCDQAQMRERLGGIADLMRASLEPVGPALVLAALVHAEIIAVRPFVAGNALVARAVERLLLDRAGVDPLGVAVVEAGHAIGGGVAYRGALTAYVEGGSAGVALWLQHCGEAVVEGAAQGQAIAESILAGRLN